MRGACNRAPANNSDNVGLFVASAHEVDFWKVMLETPGDLQTVIFRIAAAAVFDGDLHLAT